MRKTILLLKGVFLFVFMCFVLFTNAQCPATVTATIASQTVATCPSNATVTLGSNANGVATATYQVITAPSGVSLAPQSSNIFTSLPPGNYTFKVTCGASSANVNTVITSTYTQLTASTLVTNVCTSYTAGGSITVTAAGGTTPYTYSLLKTVNANYTDALSSYGASNILNPTDSGTYQVRIKDNCGNFITKTVIVQPLVPAIYLHTDFLSNDQPCGSGNIRLYYFLSDINGNNLSSASFPFGYKLDIYQKAAGCTRGAFIKTVNKAQNSSNRVVIPVNQDIYVKVTNSCGDTTSVCYTYPVGSTTYKIHWTTVQTGCTSIANPNGFVSLANDYSEYGKGPELYSVVKLDGTVMRTPTADSSVFHNLPYGTYVIVGQDACGLIARDTLVPYSPGDVVYFDEWQDLSCTNQTGTITYNTFVHGYVTDLEHAVLTIVSGPSNVGVVGLYYPQYGVVRWANMLPGNYVASIVTPCGTTLVNFTLVVYIPTLQQTLQVTTEQACNNGGVIYANLTYNGSGTTSFGLFNAANVNIATNITGVFTGLTVGNYTVKASIESGGECPSIYTINMPASILADGAPPQVVKKIVMICEDAIGNPLGNGKAIIRSLGFAPFKIEAKKVIDSDASYVLKYAASVNDFTVDNLLPYENYRIRITDQCGNTALTDVSVGILEQLTPINNGTPCYGQTYTLSAPDMIDAVYTWKKGGVTVATSKDIVFASYIAANDGAYTCTISIGGGCVTRLVNNTLSGQICSILATGIVSFSANMVNCNTQVKWELGSTNALSNIAIQRSDDGINFKDIKTIIANNNGVAADNYLDENLASGTNFYRLVITDNDGRKILSKVVSVKNTCNTAKSSLVIYPNPVEKGNDINIRLESKTIGNTQISILNNMGQLLLTKTIITKLGNNTTTIPSVSLTNGAYIVRIVLPNGETLIQKLIKE
jgi:Secretion system C-terminal sorting domain